MFLDVGAEGWWPLNIVFFDWTWFEKEGDECSKVTNEIIKTLYHNDHMTPHTHTRAHTCVDILTDDTQFFRVCWCVFAQTVATCVCIRSEDTHKSKRILTEDTHHVISWTGDFITKSIFSRISTYVTRLRFRYVTPWILARFHDKNNDISWTSLP